MYKTQESRRVARGWKLDRSAMLHRKAPMMHTNVIFYLSILHVAYVLCYSCPCGRIVGSYYPTTLVTKIYEVFIYKHNHLIIIISLWPRKYF